MPVTMLDFLKQLAAAIPAYFGELVRLLSGPKRFIAERLAKRELTVKNALVFLAISFLLVTVLTLPAIRGDPAYIGATAAFTLLYVTAYATAVHCAWRLVGGKAALDKVLPTYFYFAGVLELMLKVTFLAMMGAMRVADNDVFQEMLNEFRAGNAVLFLSGNAERLGSSPGIQLAIAVEFIGIAAMVVWFVAGWGAYREMNGLSKWRSLAAGFLFLPLSLAVTTVMFLIAIALVTLMQASSGESASSLFPADSR